MGEMLPVLIVTSDIYQVQMLHHRFNSPSPFPNQNPNKYKTKCTKEYKGKQGSWALKEIF